MADDKLSEAELAEYIRDVCETAIKHLAALRTVDRDALADDVRAELEQHIGHRMMVFAMTEPEAVADHLAAAEALWRQLTLEESRALLLKQ
jgi:hypothetical protein